MSNPNAREIPREQSDTEAPDQFPHLAPAYGLGGLGNLGSIGSSLTQSLTTLTRDSGWLIRIGVGLGAGYLGWRLWKQHPAAGALAAVVVAGLAMNAVGTTGGILGGTEYPKPNGQV